jgi:hypothetical protein
LGASVGAARSQQPPADVPARRWLRFLDDRGRFIHSGWAECATSLGWGPLDLFGCDRERPFARVDHMGLLWLLDGREIIELHRDHATIETETALTKFIVGGRSKSVASCWHGK